MNQLIAKLVPENPFKKIFYLHSIFPLIIVIIMEIAVGRRVGNLSYLIATIYIAYSTFRLIKERSNAPSGMQKIALPAISGLIVLFLLGILFGSK